MIRFWLVSLFRWSKRAIARFQQRATPEMNPLVLLPLTQEVWRRRAIATPKSKRKSESRGNRGQSRWERERNLNGRRTGWSELVGVGRLVWPTGADTRRKHARRNVARFVASCTYRYTCTGHVHGGGLACTYARVSQGERTDARWGRERRRRSDERKARDRKGTAHH